MVYANCLHKFAELVTELRQVNQGYKEIEAQEQAEDPRHRFVGKSNKKLVHELAKRDGVEDKQEKINLAREIKKEAIGRLDTMHKELHIMLGDAK